MVGGGCTAGILGQTVTLARQTSIMTSRPARRNYKTGRAHGCARQQAARRSGGRAAGRPRRASGVWHTVGGVATRRRRCAGAGIERAASGERRYGARAQVLWAQQPPRAGAAARRAPRAPARRALARTKTTNLSSVHAGPPIRGRCPGCLSRSLLLENFQFVVNTIYEAHWVANAFKGLFLIDEGWYLILRLPTSFLMNFVVHYVRWHFGTKTYNVANVMKVIFCLFSWRMSYVEIVTRGSRCTEPGSGARGGGESPASLRWRDVAPNSCYKICDLRRWNCPTLRNFPYWTFMQRDISFNIIISYGQATVTLLCSQWTTER